VRLWEIFRYDVASQFRRYSTLIYAAGLMGLTLLVWSTFLDDARRDGVYLNAPMVVTATAIMISMVGMIVTAALAAESVTRDTNARMEPLLYTTPLPKATYLGGRFLSAFAIGALLLTLAPVAMLLGRFIPGLDDPAWWGPYRPGAYLSAYLFSVLPNVFIATALLFSLVALTRKAMLAYLGGAVLFMNSLLQDEYVAGVLGRWDLARLLDPFGFMIARAQWRSWTMAQRNVMTLQFEDALLTNRLIWIGVSLAMLTLVYLRFRMAHHAPAAGWWRRRRHPERSEGPGRAVATTSAPPTAQVPRYARDDMFVVRVRQTLAIAWHAYVEMITSRAALAFLGMGFLLYRITEELLEVGLGTPTAPATGRIVMLYSKFSTMGIFAGALLVYFAGYLVWRERDARENDVTDAAPVPDSITLLGKFGALVLIVMTMQATMVAAGVATQMTYGYSNYEPLLYLKVLFGLKLVDYLLFAVLVFAVHIIVNQKYLGTAIAMLAWLYPGYADEVGIQHNLLKYASDTGLQYSDLSGFGPTLGPWLWFKLYWLGFALLLALAARLFWVRGHEGRRLKLARARFTRGYVVAAAAALLLIAGAGGFIFYNTNILNPYLTAEELDTRAADYEKTYGKYADLAQPVVAATKLNVELYPSKGAADIRGTYRLENRSGRAVDAIHIVTGRTAKTGEISFDRAARASVLDERLGYRIYKLDQPLAPGDSLKLDFSVQFARRGFTNSGISNAIVSNGTLLEHRPDNTGRAWLPSVGYRRSAELNNANTRFDHGLPKRSPFPTLEDIPARSRETGIERIALETIISTDADQTAVAPGALKRSWNEGGRRYFHYVTDAPIRNGFPILSARYEVHRSNWNGVDVEVLHHPGHGWNAERFAKSAQTSLDYFSKQFGPYPHRQLRLVEFPLTGGNRLTGHPGTVIWSEHFAYAQPDRDWRKIDFLSGVIGHEVSHQWWGNIVAPARVEGAPLLSESLAWYSGMMIVKQMYGDEHLDRFMEVMRAAYLAPNATAEVPLVRANDWLATYRTGALAMFSLREAIGEERVNLALHRYANQFRSGRPPFPTSIDLMAHLRAVAPYESQPLLTDLFEEITFWDFRMKSIDVQPAGGAHRVTLGVEAWKIKADASARETRAPLDEIVEITLFDEKGEPIYLKKHRLRSGKQQITVTVPKAPHSAGVDAKHKFLDRIRTDNVREVAVRGSGM
jgi:ABC-2 type transport system permease protein